MAELTLTAPEPLSVDSRRDNIDNEEAILVTFNAFCGKPDTGMGFKFTHPVPISLTSDPTKNDDLGRFLHAVIERNTNATLHGAALWLPCELCGEQSTGLHHTIFLSGVRGEDDTVIDPTVLDVVATICGGFCAIKALEQSTAESMKAFLSVTTILICKVCGNRKGIKLCGGCRAFRYCSAECQKKHWPDHKKECRRKKENLAKIEDQIAEVKPESGGDAEDKSEGRAVDERDGKVKGEGNGEAKKDSSGKGKDESNGGEEDERIEGEKGESNGDAEDGGNEGRMPVHCTGNAEMCTDRFKEE